ncbi:tetratricopeptide repeat protein [Clostridium sp. B9]|uniref:tetratricopeptide repeat protein n=1 Tax=Clostridium sp. B9 TaxID=3423224 RepID=UPI003D2F1BE3
MNQAQSLVMILICILTIIIILYLIESDNFLPEKQIQKCVSLGKYNKALYFLDKHSEKLDPLFFYNNKILALSKGKDFNAAYELSIEALRKIKEPNHQLYNNIAFVYYNLNLYHRAIELSKKALDLNPLDLYALSNKGFAHIKIGEYEKAEASFDKALEFNPFFKNALSGKAYCTYEKGDYKTSVDLLEDFISIDQTEAPAFKKLGECYFYLNDLKSSSKMYEKALELNPKSETYYCEYANVLLHLGLYDKALDALDEALSLSPFNFIAFYYKARAYALKKDANNAFYYLERALHHCDCLKEIALEDEMLNNLKFFSRFSELLEINS